MRIIILIAICVGLVILSAFWLSCLWGWFVVGVVPWATPITTWQAFGLQLVATSLIAPATATAAIQRSSK